MYYSELIERHKKFIFGMIFGILFVLILPFTIYVINGVYSSVDKTQFPFEGTNASIEAWKQNKSNGNECAVMTRAIYHQLQMELKSTFGWSANDLFFSPTAYLDNRRNRELGVLSATRLIFNQFSTGFAKYGSSNEEDPNLKIAREQYLNQSAYTWGFMRTSAESDYNTGIAMMEKYIAEVHRGKAVYNVRTDNIYNMITYILSPELFDTALGKLINTDITFFDADDRCYYAQGVMLVIRNVVRTMDILYPVMREKGGSENLDKAYEAMDRICMFDPVIVLAAKGDSIFAHHPSKMARDWYLVQSLLGNIRDSINR